MIMALTSVSVSLPVFMTPESPRAVWVRNWLPRRVAAPLAKGLGERVAEPPVVGFKLADPLAGELEPGLAATLRWRCKPEMGCRLGGYNCWLRRRSTSTRRSGWA